MGKAKRVSNGADKKAIVKMFADRVIPRKAFWDAYESCKEPDSIYVLHYFGIGGIGKSRLIKKLCEELDGYGEANKFSPIYIHTDMKADPLKDELKFMDILRDAFKAVPGARFRRFDISHLIYSKAVNEEYDPDGKDIFSPVAEVLESAAGGFEPIAQLMDFTTAAFETAIDNTKLLIAAKSFVTNLSRKKREKAEKLENTKDDIRSSTELLEKIRKSFILDMQENMDPDINKQLKNCHLPIVIFIDTFESLVNPLNTVGVREVNAYWLSEADREPSGLIPSLPNVLWVIAGRERLDWPQRYKDGFYREDGTLTQIPLEYLGREDSCLYLEAAGVEDEALRHELYDLTYGFPQYLGLCADINERIKDKGIAPTIKDFGDERDELPSRLTEYMDDRTRSILYVLSLLPYWTYDIASDILSSIPSLSFTEEHYNIIMDLSMVSEEGAGVYYLSPLVSDSFRRLGRQKSPHLMKNALERIAEFCHRTLTPLSPSSEEYEKTLTFMARVLSEGATDEEAYALYTNTLKKHFDRMISQGFLHNAYSAALHLPKRNDSETKYSAAVKRDTANMLLLLKKSSPAAVKEQISRDAEEAFHMSSHLFGEGSAEAMEAQLVYIRTLISLGERKKAARMLEELRCASSLLFGRSLYYRASSLLASSLKELKQTSLASEILKELYDNFDAFSFTDETEGERQRIHLISALAKAYADLDNEEEAGKLFKESYERTYKSYGENHPLTYQAMSDCLIASSYFMSAELPFDLFKLMEAVYDMELPEELDTEMLESVEAIASQYLLGTKLNIAIYNARRAMLGDDHPDTVIALADLCLSAFDASRSSEECRKKALLLAKNSIEDLASSLSEDSFPIRYLLSAYCEMLEKEGLWSLSLPVREKLYNMNIISGREGYAKALFTTGAYDEAYTLYNDLYKSREGRTAVKSRELFNTVRASTLFIPSRERASVMRALCSAQSHVVDMPAGRYDLGDKLCAEGFIDLGKELLKIQLYDLASRVLKIGYETIDYPPYAIDEVSYYAYALYMTGKVNEAFEVIDGLEGFAENFYSFLSDGEEGADPFDEIDDAFLAQSNRNAERMETQLNSIKEEFDEFFRREAFIKGWDVSDISFFEGNDTPLSQAEEDFIPSFDEILEMIKNALDSEDPQ